MNWAFWGLVRAGRSARSLLLPSHCGKVLSKKVLKGKVFFAYHEYRCSRLCQEVLEMPGSQPSLSYPCRRFTSISTPWPFHTLGLDLLGPFTPTIGQLKHLIVAVDYYPKWIELEPFASIAYVKVQNFVFRQIICCFGIPTEVICDNETQFTDKKFREMLAGLHIKQYFASVEHPQSNG